MVDSDDEDLSEWTSAGIATDEAKIFIDSDVTLEAAKEWLAKTDYSPDDIVDLIEKNVSLSEAIEFEERGIEPRQVTRTESGLELDLEPWQEDPADQLPSRIEPGNFRIRLWTTAMGGDPVAHDVSFTWHGSQTAEWYEDISSVNEGLSMMSSSPVHGVLAWPNGNDIVLTYAWGDLGLAGHDRLPGRAPISDGDAGDPDSWLTLADALIDFVLLDLGSRLTSEPPVNYLDTDGDVELDLDDMLRRYAETGGGPLLDFEGWLDEVTTSGKYRTLTEDD